MGSALPADTEASDTPDLSITRSVSQTTFVWIRWNLGIVSLTPNSLTPNSLDPELPLEVLIRDKACSRKPKTPQRVGSEKSTYQGVD